MERNILWLILFFLFLFEGSVLPFFLPEWIGSAVYVKLVPMLLMMVGIFYHRHSALLYGICFGFLHDLLYGQMMGAAAFGMGITAYLIGVMFGNRYDSMFRDITVIVAGLIFYEIIMMIIYFIFGLYHPVTAIGYVTEYFLPLIILNIVFAIVLYLPAKKFLRQMAVRNLSYTSN